ncbi:MAG: DUF4160 domain-containing protein [Deltaproteobacteria bacterium]|nr:DUF4160 domain-containing protein [Deltaproteobacteria bacterium]
MPTILRQGPYRFFFYSGDGQEPRHVHVERDDNVAKFWLAPVRLQASGGFSPAEIGRIAGIIEDHRREFVEAWNEYFRG